MIIKNENLKLGIINNILMSFGLAEFCGNCGIKKPKNSKNWEKEAFGSYSRGIDYLHLCPNCKLF